MAASKEKESAKRGTITPKRDTAPDDYPDDLDGEFASLDDQMVKNLGTICGLAIRGGGYFGISCTDDGQSVRLAVRNGAFVLDKRFSARAKLEGALAYCLRKLE